MQYTLSTKLCLQSANCRTLKNPNQRQLIEKVYQLQTLTLVFAGGLPKQCLRFFVSGFFLPPVALLLWNESRDIPMKIDMNIDLESQKVKHLFFKDVLGQT